MHPLIFRFFGGLLCAALLVLAAKLVPLDQGRKLNLFIWSGYLAPDTISGFQKRYGVTVSLNFYDANEAVLAKLQSGNVDFDLIVPSDYMVEILIREKLVQELDKGSLKNFKNVDPRFLNLHYDPGNRFCVPYFWGTTGVGYRKDKVRGELTSWKTLWEPRYAERITMLDDMRENFAAALKSLGYSLNTSDPAKLEAAKQLLMTQKPLLKAYNSGNFQEMLLSGDAWIVQGFSGQIAKAMKENPNVGYAIPSEGCTISVDNLCIPKTAPHPDLAHQFIDYVLEAEVAAGLCNFTYYSTPNLAARQFLPPHVLDNSAVFPTDEAVAHCEFITDLGDAVRIYDRAWTEIKSR